MKQVSTNFPGETTTAYNYDGLGKRRNRITDYNGVNPELTWWRWDLGWTPLCEYAVPDVDWEIEGFAQFNVYNGLMHPLAEAAVSGSPANAAYSYLALDHLSSTRMVYNQAKTATASLEFYPYGETFAATGALPDARFTAKPYDPETGLYYFPYRYYSPTASRWITRDPLGMIDGPNVYGYVSAMTTIKRDWFGSSQSPFDDVWPSILPGPDSSCFHRCMYPAAEYCAAYQGPAALVCLAALTAICAAAAAACYVDECMQLPDPPTLGLGPCATELYPIPNKPGRCKCYNVWGYPLNVNCDVFGDGSAEGIPGG